LGILRFQRLKDQKGGETNQLKMGILIKKKKGNGGGKGNRSETKIIVYRRLRGIAKKEAGFLEKRSENGHTPKFYDPFRLWSPEDSLREFGSVSCVARGV